MLKKAIACLIAAAGLAVAIPQWDYIIEKLTLYFREYNCTPYLNHTSDGIFAMAYEIDGILIAAGIASVILVKTAPVRWRVFPWLSLLLNLAGCITLMVMQHYAVLVEYTVFARHMFSP